MLEMTTSGAELQEKPLILLADPSLTTQVAMDKALPKQGFDVITSGDWDTAKKIHDNFRPDLTVIDTRGLDQNLSVLGQLNGPKIVTSTVPKDRENAFTIKALQEGADFYLQKPVSPGLLSAHIRASLRSREKKKDLDNIQIGNATISTRGGILIGGEMEETLTRTETELLTYLAASRGRVLLRDELLRDAWGKEYEGDVQYLRVWISRLRGKLASMGEHDAIRTYGGAGYMLSSYGSRPNELMENELVPIKVSSERNKNHNDDRKRLLAVDSDHSTLNILRYTVPGKEYQLRTTSDADSAERIIEVFSPHMLLVGEEFVVLQQDADTAIPWIAMNKNTYRAATQLDLGASTSTEKPIMPEVLLAQMKNISRSWEKDFPIYENGKLYIDIGSRKYTLEGNPISLTRKESQLLEVLVKSYGSVVTTETVCYALGRGDDVDEKYVRVYISRLREKLEIDCIRTESGRGYVFEI